MAEKEKLESESTTTLFRIARAVAANKRIVSNSIPYLLRDAENDLFIRTLAWKHSRGPLRPIGVCAH